MKYHRACGGYETARRTKDPKRLVWKQPALLPAIKTFPDLATSSEQRSFEFFRSITAPSLSSDYDSSFWVATVLKFFHLTPSVRHAVLAVSSLHESLVYDGLHLSGKLGDKQIFALQKYNKAISLFRQQVDHQNDCEPIVPLLLCILFVCMEFMQRKNTEALMHLRQGRQLLDTLARSGHLPDGPLETIRQYIVPMYMRSGLTSYLFGVDTVAVPKMVNPFLDLPAVFSSIQQARHAFYTILDDSLRWRFLYKTSQHLDPRIPTDFAYQTAYTNKTQPTPQDITAFELEQQTLLSRLSKWNTAFSLFRSTGPSESRSTPSMLLLQILYHTSIIWTSTAMSQCELVFDEHTERFSALVPLCAEYLEATKPGSQVTEGELSQGYRRRRPMTSAPERQQPNKYPEDNKLVFTFETGIVPILFLIAAKCRHPKIRRAAVNLLSTHDERHENLWKAKCFARIASRFVDIETESGEEFQRRNTQPPFPPAAIESYSGQLAWAPDTTIRGRCARQETGSRDAQSHVSTTAARAKRSGEGHDSSQQLSSTECCHINSCGNVNNHSSRGGDVFHHSHPDYLNSSDSLNLGRNVRTKGLDPHTQLNATLGVGPAMSSSAPMNHPDTLQLRPAPAKRDAEPERGGSALLPVCECLEAPFGLPEELRISDAIVGQHEEEGMPVTFFRKPNQFCGEWEIWKEFVLFD